MIDRCLFIIGMLMASWPSLAQDMTLWDGEVLDPLSCNTSYGSVVSGPDAYAGSYYFLAEPDPFHSSKIGFNCSGMWRSDLSGYDELRFYIKSSLADQITSVRFTTYNAKSPWVNLEAFVQGGGKITMAYKEVRIPLSAFKTPTYNLGSIEYIEFEPNAVAGLKFYVDNIKVVDSSAPIVKFKPVSNQVAMLQVSERFTITDVYDVQHYSVTSATDPAYQAAVHPARIGRHQYVTGLAPGSGSPLVAFELYPIFNKPFINNHTYTLHVDAITDLSGNATSFDTTFSFSDLGIYGNVKANQVGYLPDSPKLAKLGNFLGDAWFLPVSKADPPTFQVINDAQQVLYSGTATFLKSDSAFSGEDVFELDFSTLSIAGHYHIYVPGYGRSEEFSISASVYDQAYYHSLRALYYQRSGKLEAPQAGLWARDGLPATTAEIHSSHSTSPLFSNTDPAPGTQIPMTKGWLDAGDFGRYVPTAASALFIFFTAFELYPEKFPDGFSNIPESGNGIPDLIDELKYETDWLKQMQAPDGGVYFRVTPATWSPGLPGEENNTLFVSEKTTQSTAVFAAAMAMAYRNFLKYDPNYAQQCLLQAKKAWTFLQSHPDATPAVKMEGINAGPYPDPEDRDNRAWAAAELYKTTGEPIYNTGFLNWYGQIPHHFHAPMHWAHRTYQAAWAYATTKFPTDQGIVDEFKSKIGTEILNNYYDRTMNAHAYHGAYHPFKGYIAYGTFGMAQSYAFDYIMFSYLLNKPDLLELAKIQLDIPLGNNPLSRTFITGLGRHSPKSPLHWSTVPGKFSDPVPGVPVFGPAATLMMNRASSFAIQDSANRYPYGFKKEDPYPVLRRYTDSRSAVEMAEFTVQEMAVTAATFAYFSSIISTPLPVHLATFDAKPDKCKVTLRWTTSEEINADYFLVQRSQDGISFHEIGRQAAAGNTRSNQSYSFVDTNPALNNYYRLKQVDYNGKSELSRIVFGKNCCNGLTVNIMEPKPNLFEIRAETMGDSKTQSLKVQLISKEGITRRSLSFKSNTITPLHAHGFLPGVYILLVTNDLGDVVFSEKLLIR